jgi:hypothetical protein
MRGSACETSGCFGCVAQGMGAGKSCFGKCCLNRNRLVQMGRRHGRVLQKANIEAVMCCWMWKRDP